MGATDGQIEALYDVTGAGAAALAGFPDECLGTAPTISATRRGRRAGGPVHPAERAALLFAEQMTIGPGRVPPTTFERLGEFFEAGEIVEIAAVVGLFNYFNRFNNALEVEVTR